MTPKPPLPNATHHVIPRLRDALERKGPPRRPQRRSDRRLEEVAEAVGGGYWRLQVPLRLALAVRETVAGHRTSALEGGGGASPPSNASLPTPPPPPLRTEAAYGVPDRTFFGQFPDIRERLDYSYHVNYTEARQLWQDDLVNSVVCRTVPQPLPWVVFTCGAMGAGKGHVMAWMSAENIFPLENIVQIDPDVFKRNMPEWPGCVQHDPPTPLPPHPPPPPRAHHPIISSEDVV